MCRQLLNFPSTIWCVCVYVFAWDSTFQQLSMLIIIFQSTIINWSCVNIVLCVCSAFPFSLSHIISPWDNINLWRQGGRRQKCSISGNFCAITENVFCVVWSSRSGYLNYEEFIKIEKSQKLCQLICLFQWLFDFIWTINFSILAIQTSRKPRFPRRKLINVNKEKIVHDIIIPEIVRVYF